MFNSFIIFALNNKTMEIKLIKSINISGTVFKMRYDKKVGPMGNFDFDTGIMNIGIKGIEQSPEAVLSIIAHEIMEAIHIITNTRYLGFGGGEEYLFVSTHKEYQTNIELFTPIFLKFIK